MQTFFCCPREGQIARGRGRRRARSSKRDKNGGKKILENCCLLPSTPTLQPLLGGPSTNAGPCYCCRGLSKRTRDAQERRLLLLRLQSKARFSASLFSAEARGGRKRSAFLLLHTTSSSSSSQ